MNSIFKLPFLLLTLLFSTNVFAKYIAILETVSLDDAIRLQEKRYLTDKLREVASIALDSSFTIMTSENIEVMLPPGKRIEDCEGSCLIETGKNISADYVAQGRIGSFGEQFTLSVELYETATGKLIGSFVERRNSIQEIAEEVEQNAIFLFCKIQSYQQKDNCKQHIYSNDDGHQSEFWIAKSQQNSLTKDSDNKFLDNNDDKEYEEDDESTKHNPIPFDLHLLLDISAGATSYSAQYYGSAVESLFGPGFQFGLGFDIERLINHRFILALGTSFNAYYEYIDFSIPLRYTNSGLYSSYTNTSDYGYEYTSWFFRLNLSAMIGFGDGNWFLFARPALSIGLGNNISFQKNSDDIAFNEPDYRPTHASTNVNSCIGIIDIGFRIFDNHEIYVQVTPPLFSGDHIEKFDYSIYLGYRWIPTLINTLFSL